jgi:myo-inositol-1-phosphate synthase
MSAPRIGIWLLGARGGVAATTILGLCALRRGLVGNAGLVTELPQLAGLGLAGWDDFEVGGHDIRDISLVDEAMRLAGERALDGSLVEACREDLDAIDTEIRPGTLVNVGETIENLADNPKSQTAETPRAAVERIQGDLKAFVESKNLDRLIVVNVASTEPPVDLESLPQTWDELSGTLDSADDCPLAASSIYAIATLDLGHAYVNFTPSLGSLPAAICELADLRGACHVGRDGKTGETLLKSTLAPMFAARNLQVMSWVGHNIFGNMDGVVLNDPANKATKVDSKDQLLGQIFGYQPQTLVSIEYIKSLGDWKTAWDHIHFQGFLGTPMTLQFTWQGCDSLLAAPLVLDLVRLTERAQRAGQTGILCFLSSFFKSPMGVEENRFAAQFAMLEAWAAEMSAS